MNQRDIPEVKPGKTIPIHEAHALLKLHFAFDEFRPGQEKVIQCLFEGKSALAVFPTGAGKSLCYQLPALALEGVTLVVSPLIALMKDQIDFLTRRGIAASRLDSSLSVDEARSVTERLRNGRLKLLYVAPERFNNERFIEDIRRCRIALFAVDEAHCISEWGHNFRPDYLKLAECAKSLKVDRILAITATATPPVVRDICSFFSIPSECAVITGFYRPNLCLITTPVREDERDRLLLDRLRDRPPGPTIVYVTLQKTSERVAAQLENAGLPARAYHAGMEDEERTKVQDEWMASDRGIVVATIAFGMGIDKENVRAVYHYNQPKSLESYSQEIGRAGRDGALSTVELFACPEDISVLENFVYGDTPTQEALTGLISEIFAMPREFDVSLSDLSLRHDMRPLVLRTALTYLELFGLICQGTPFFAGYKARPLRPLQEIFEEFEGERAQFLKDLFDHASKGRIWFSFRPDNLATSMGQDRTRIVRALNYLEEKGWVEIQPSDVRLRYSRTDQEVSPSRVIQDMAERFLRREKQDVARVHAIRDLVTSEGCQMNFLVGYFGEDRDEPCGHCTRCISGQSVVYPKGRAVQAVPSGLDVSAFHKLREEHPDELKHPRAAARFLAGLTSPKLIKAKLTRHELFGALDDRCFAESLAWCEGSPR